MDAAEVQTIARLRRGLRKRKYTIDELVWLVEQVSLTSENWRPTARLAKIFYERYKYRRQHKSKLPYNKWLRYWNNLEWGTKWAYAELLDAYEPLPLQNVLYIRPLYEKYMNYANELRNTQSFISEFHNYFD